MNEFWKIRKKLCAKSDDDMYNTKTEEGKTIEDPDEAKEHIAMYFENLYQARPGKPEYQNWTEKIIQTVKEIDQAQNKLPNPKPISEEEIDEAIKSLKRNKIYE